MLAFPDNNYKDKWRWLKSTLKLGAYTVYEINYISSNDFSFYDGIGNKLTEAEQ